MTADDLGAPPRRHTENSTDALARGLGWFSIALGVGELVAPRAVANCLGMRDSVGMVRACGAREVATGIGILGSGDKAPWIWGRVAGDLLDLALLTRGLGRDNPRRANAGLALGTVAAVTLVDVACARALSETETAHYVARDYSDRSGFPKPASEMRGAAAASVSSGPSGP